MSEPDELLERLGALEREHDAAFPHAWEDVVRGERTTAEALAEREGIDDPAELRALAEVLRPLGEQEREAWVERLATGSRTLEQRPGPAPSSAPEGSAAVVSFESRRHPRSWMRWLGGTGAFAAAAALLLWVLEPRDEGPGSAELAALPDFELVVRNETVHASRSKSDPRATARYEPSSSLHWVIRPEHSVDPPLGLRVLADALSPEIPSSQRRLLLDPGAIEVSPQGVIELRGRLEDALPLAAGHWSLRMLVAKPDALPADLAAYDAGGAWVVSEPYEIEVIP
jgi:hypothetical protein